MRPSHVTVSWARLAGAGLLLTAVVLGAGAVLERYRFGPGNEAARDRLRREIAATVAAHARDLRQTAVQLAGQPTLPTALADGPD